MLIGLAAALMRWRHIRGMGRWMGWGDKLAYSMSGNTNPASEITLLFNRWVLIG